MNTFEQDAEWLEADGLGGFAMGTVGLVRRRRYHALLCAATSPPAGRSVLLAGVDAVVHAEAGPQPLSAQAYGGTVIAPRGDLLLRSFAAEPWPTWEFELADGRRVRHEVMVPRGHAAVVLTWTLVDAGAGDAAGDPAAALVVRPFLAMRDYHALQRENAVRVDAEVTGDPVTGDPVTGDPVTGDPVAGDPVAGDEVRWRAVQEPSRALAARANGGYRAAPHWYRAFHYQEEAVRGYDATEDLYAPGEFTFDLRRGPAHLIVAAGDLPAGWRATDVDGDVGAVAMAVRARELRRRQALPSPLHRAAEAYVVARGTGSSIIAGYPWFADWGRDTFLAMRGLLLANGQRDTAGQVLAEWARHLDGGMLPNRFPDRDGPVEYHSVDAPLWFAVAAHEYLTGGDVPVGRRQVLVAAITTIVRHFTAGTRHGIGMAPDGLLRAGAPGVQLTWMDAIVGDRVVTPRAGKPVEVQALWINTLAIAAELDDRWRGALRLARASFASRFWNADAACLYDVVDLDHDAARVDGAVRPNQILAVGGLPLPLLEGERARAVVDCVQRRLWTPLGLRSLAPGHPDYRGRCAGSPAERDLAYHNGTAWAWLLGPFVEAWVRVHGGSNSARAAAAQQFVRPLRQHLGRAGLGHLSEIADGDAPHTPRGCPFQAWSLGELLRLEQTVLRLDPIPARPRPDPTDTRAQETRR